MISVKYLTWNDYIDKFNTEEKKFLIKWEDIKQYSDGKNFT